MAYVKWVGGTHRLTDLGVWTPAAPANGDVGSVTSGHVGAVNATVGNYEINLLGTATSTTFDGLGTTIGGQVGSFQNFDPTLPNTSNNNGTVALTGANINNGFLGASGNYLSNSFPGSQIVIGDVTSPDGTVIEQGILTNNGTIGFSEGGHSSISSPFSDAVIINSGTLSLGTPMAVGVAVEGTGTITASASARDNYTNPYTLAAVSAGQTLQLHGVLTLSDPLNFRAKITGFANSYLDSIGFAKPVTSALFLNGVLYLQNGSTLVAALTFPNVSATDIIVTSGSSSTLVRPNIPGYGGGNIAIATTGTAPTVPAIVLPAAVQYLPDSGPNQVVTAGAEVAANQTLNGYSVFLQGSGFTPSLDVSGVTFGRDFLVESNGMGSSGYAGTLNAVGVNTNLGTIEARTDASAMPTPGTGQLTVTLSDVVSPDGVLLVAGTFYNEGLIDTDAGSSIAISGGANDAFVNDGSFTDNGAITIAAAVSGDGTIVVGGTNSPLHSASLTFGVVGAVSPVSSGQTIVLEDGTLNITDLPDFNGAITDYGSSSTLVLKNYTATSYTYANGVLDLSGTTSGALRVQGAGGMNLSASSFNVQQNGTDTVITAAACYCAGTLILTDRGEAPVETLGIGDTVITASGEHRPIRWIGHRSYIGRFLAANPNVQPIRFRVGSLGDGLPLRDLVVSPEHAMLFDAVLVPAKALVNGSTIMQERGLERVDYFHVELDSHDVLLAEGAPSESFLDDGNRSQFHNATEHAALYSDAPGLGDRCAPWVDSGFKLEAIRARLAEAAGDVARAA